MKALTVNESLAILTEKSHVRRASNKFENINDALSKLYDVMSKSDKNFKNKIFWQYYRFYNDGDIFKFPYETLKKLGMSDEDVHNLQHPYTYSMGRRREAMRYKSKGYEWVYGPYEKGLEKAIEVTARYLLKKYAKQLDRPALYLEKKKDIYDNIKSDNFSHYYWIKEYGKDFNIPELVEIAEYLKNKDKEGSFTKNDNALKSLSIGKFSPIGIKERIKELIEDDIKKSEDKIGYVKESVSSQNLTTEQNKAIKLLEEIGLKFISTPAQLKHGTLFFHDPYSHYDYSITSAGYARKHNMQIGRGMFTNAGEDRHYQLNPVKKINVNRNNYDYTRIERIMFPGEYVKLAEIIKRVALKNRNPKTDENILKDKNYLFGKIKEDNFKNAHPIKIYGKKYNIPELVEISKDMSNMKEDKFKKEENPFKSLGIGKTSAYAIKSRITDIIEKDIKETENKLNKNESKNS